MFLSLFSTIRVPQILHFLTYAQGLYRTVENKSNRYQPQTSYGLVVLHREYIKFLTAMFFGKLSAKIVDFNYLWQLVSFFGSQRRNSRSFSKTLLLNKPKFWQNGNQSSFRAFYS